MASRLRDLADINMHVHFSKSFSDDPDAGWRWAGQTADPNSYADLIMQPHVCTRLTQAHMHQLSGLGRYHCTERSPIVARMVN